ncbi:MAG TPA: substrate-binding domain-containing protein [Acidimicrobiales bacterium]|nr:substrate-binding domain-containing protein [Acidimicrobiales bacterium]
MAVWVLALFVAAACTVGGDGDGDGDSATDRVPEGCTAVDMAVSPEKVELLTELARQFNGSEEAESGDVCAFVRVHRKSSGTAMQLLAQGWPEDPANGPRPIVWSPASSAWGAVLNQRLAEAGQPAMAAVATGTAADPNAAKPFMLTPLVIAMPRPMAEALGWPSTPIGYGDILKLAQDPAGWGGKGHPEWGPFRLGKTNPNFSTSALSATIAQYYAATGKTRDLSIEDLARPEVDAFARGVESSVVHYGDITLTFLNNWYRNDARGTALTYASAVAVEEKSVIDYNRGDPDGIRDPGEQPRAPRVPLVAIYPKEGTLFSDNPFIVLDAPWVPAEAKDAARLFERFVQKPENQQRVVSFGFRPGNPQVAAGDPIVPANGVDPSQPQNVLGVPEPPVLDRIIDVWGEQRKSARVLLVVDVSGSMGDPADGGGATKLDLAKQAAIDALGQFKADDQVGLRIFSTEISRTPPTDYVDVVPIGPIGAQREVIATRIRSLTPTNGTPLYTVTSDSFTAMQDAYDPARINAVVLLSDGRNEDRRNNNLDELLSTLRAGSEGQGTRPVRVFPIAYGKDADLGVLRRIAEATNAAAYDAGDPTTINQVFTAVISNF